MGCPCKSSNWNQIGFQIKIRKITWVIKLFQNLLLKYLRKKITFFSISAIGLQQDFQKLDWQNNSGHDHLTLAANAFFLHSSKKTGNSVSQCELKTDNALLLSFWFDLLSNNLNSGIKPVCSSVAWLDGSMIWCFVNIFWGRGNQNV